MLSIFRRYQRILFVITTFFIVCSFVFFGVYGALDFGPTRVDHPAFKTVTGETVYTSELQEMVFFLKSDATDLLHSEVGDSFNFLNDGVIRRDFLEGGLASSLLTHFKDEIAKDIESRWSREKKYKSYVHPQVPFISARIAWSYLSPETSKNLGELKSSSDPLSEEALQARVQLYLAESALPGARLRQVLLQQEQQQEWVRPDPALRRVDLSLFGYHSLDDWFGSRFIELACQVIINGAEQATSLGYEVSTQEASAELLRNAQASYQQLQERTGAPNSRHYLQAQLQKMGVSHTAAVKIWQKVLLFRRLFQGAGDSVIVDRFMYEQFNSFAKKGVSVDLYQFPSALQLTRSEDLQQLELYLRQATDSSGWTNEAPLDLATDFLDPDKVLANQPELVQKRFLCAVAEVDLETLQTQVGVRQMWQWQGNDSSWVKLVGQFPELAQSQVMSADSRVEAIEQLGEASRSLVDRFSRGQIVEANPQWVAQALVKAKEREVVVGLRLKGGQLPFQGVENRQELLDLLVSEDEVDHYTPDNKHHYRIRVLDRSDEWEVLTFAQAAKDGTLDALASEALENHYKKIRTGNVTAYKTDQGEWRPLDEVKQSVAHNLYSGTLRAIKEESLDHGAEQDEMAEKTGAYWARLRMNAPLRKQRKLLLKKGDSEALLHMKEEAPMEGKLAAAPSLLQQWRIQKEKTVVRRDVEGSVEVEEALAMEEGQWSEVQESTQGRPYFYQVIGPEVDEGAIERMMLEGQKLLAAEAQQSLLLTLLEEMPAALKPSEEG